MSRVAPTAGGAIGSRRARSTSTAAPPRAAALPHAAALLCAAALGCSSAHEQATPPAREVASAPSPVAKTSLLPPRGAAPAPAAPPKPTAAPLPEADLLRPTDAPYARFFAALRALEQGRRKDHVRIAWLGDSHAAADFWSGAVRTALQERFGSGGPGFVHVGYSAYRHDRARLVTDGKWRMRPRKPSAVTVTDDGVFGLGGILFGPEKGPARAELTVLGEPKATRLLWDVCFRASAPTDEITVAIAGGASEVLRPAAGDAPGELRHARLTSEGATTLSIVPSGTPELCGVVVETDPAVRPGVVLDTLGINGARLGTPLSWNELSWAAELARRSPELVVLGYGTNEAGDAATDPALYGKQLAELLARIRRVDPDVDCLVLAPTDRRNAPERTPIIRDTLRDAAREGGCGFWDTYQQMGGRGSIDAWYRERPPRASRDGVHLTLRGYRELGVKLADELLQRYRP